MLDFPRSPQLRKTRRAAFTLLLLLPPKMTNVKQAETERGDKKKGNAKVTVVMNSKQANENKACSYEHTPLRTNFIFVLLDSSKGFLQPEVRAWGKVVEEFHSVGSRALLLFGTLIWLSLPPPRFPLHPQAYDGHGGRRRGTRGDFSSPSLPL